MLRLFLFLAFGVIIVSLMYDGGYIIKWRHWRANDDDAVSRMLANVTSQLVEVRKDNDFLFGSYKHTHTHTHRLQ